MTEQELMDIARNKCADTQDCKGCPLQMLDVSNTSECIKAGVDIIYRLLGEENVNKLKVK